MRFSPGGQAAAGRWESTLGLMFLWVWVLSLLAGCGGLWVVGCCVVGLYDQAEKGQNCADSTWKRGKPRLQLCFDNGARRGA